MTKVLEVYFTLEKMFLLSKKPRNANLTFSTSGDHFGMRIFDKMSSIRSYEHSRQTWNQLDPIFRVVLTVFICALTILVDADN
jgi:hypothetical protein